MGKVSRRGVFGFALSAGVATQFAALHDEARADSAKVLINAVPLSKVRILPSIFHDALKANQKYLLALEPDRFLHNFHKYAGLTPKAPSYGGWEERGIAGHSLGHYQSACALMWQQTGNSAFKQRVEYISAQLNEIQTINKDGYAGGTFVERDGEKIDGKTIFEEIKRGEIRSGGFDLNGGWVPIYTYHKVLNGALDGFLLCDDEVSKKVAIGLGDYLKGVFDSVDDKQLQLILGAEHGGINHSYAQLYSITKNPDYLRIAKRIRHKAIIDKIALGHDVLDSRHANTQIPKFIGLAKIYEETQDANYARTAMLFWDMVVKDHTYVIGGNSNHEHFGPPRELSNQLDQQTCEACNTYNMLKLTRHLFSWTANTEYFDFYERAHLNHIMSQIRPSDGAFTYFTPLAPGQMRVHSHPTDDFWCCVGSGMESHSKHGDSIYWQQNDNLIINLYYASELNWPEKSINLSLESSFPHSESIKIDVQKIGTKSGKIRNIWLRRPIWCASPEVYLNGSKIEPIVENNYIKLDNQIKSGDKILLKLPMLLHVSAMPDQNNLMALLHGPLVLAANLGDDEKVWQTGDPIIIGKDFLNALSKSESGFRFESSAQTYPKSLNFAPFYNMHDNKTGVYFLNLSESEWAQKSDQLLADAKAKALVESATIDFIRLGEMQSERDHELSATANTTAVSHIGLRGRLLNKGHITFNLKGEVGSKILRVTYAGRDRNKKFNLYCDGELLAEEKLSGAISNGFNVIDYEMPQSLNAHSNSLKISFQIDNDQWASIYEARLLRATDIAN